MLRCRTSGIHGVRERVSLEVDCVKLAEGKLEAADMG